MPEYGDARVRLYVGDEAVGAARDDEIDVPVLLEEGVDDVAGGDELD